MTEMSEKEIYRVADEHLFNAKESGRNQLDIGIDLPDLTN